MTPEDDTSRMYESSNRGRCGNVLSHTKITMTNSTLYSSYHPNQSQYYIIPCVIACSDEPEEIDLGLGRAIDRVTQSISDGRCADFSISQPDSRGLRIPIGAVKGRAAEAAGRIWHMSKFHHCYEQAREVRPQRKCLLL